MVLPSLCLAPGRLPFDSATFHLYRCDCLSLPSTAALYKLQPYCLLLLPAPEILRCLSDFSSWAVLGQRNQPDKLFLFSLSTVKQDGKPELKKNVMGDKGWILIFQARYTLPIVRHPVSICRSFWFLEESLATFSRQSAKTIMRE